MTCLACRQHASAAVCEPCRRSLRAPPERWVGGILVRSAFEHDGAARALVHRLKYEGVAGVADRLAAVMEPLLPATTRVLVPVPRAVFRHLSYGVDPGADLAAAIGRRTGLPVSRTLAPPTWSRQRAGPADHRRGGRRFRTIAPVPFGAVLVDDVITTGTTLVAAGIASGITDAVTATASGVRP